MFNKILVPIDVLRGNDVPPALAIALELAQTSGSRLRLVHVDLLPTVTGADIAPIVPEPPAGEPDSEERLATIAAGLQFPSERLSAVVRRGDLAMEVLAEAKEIAADLIVIGGSESSLLSAIMGTNAGALVRDAPCSILVAKQTVAS